MGKAIGIDLGTTNSVVAFKDTSVRVITTGANNEDLCRSCVAMDRNGQFVVGNAAYKQWRKYAPNIVVSAKRLMGGSISDDQVIKMKRDRESYPYGITKLSGGTDESVAIVLNGQEFTPEQISSEILKRLKEDASVKLNDTVTHAVITVPAYFNEKQKAATRKAAELAGLKVQRLLAEPTAAALSYGADKLSKDDSKVFLVYDFGGGTFDLSILVASGGQFVESGTGGDRWLGGDDIDRLLKEYVYNEVRSKQGVDINAILDGMTDKKRLAFIGELKTAIEDAKKALSVTEQTTIGLYDYLETEDGDSVDVEVTITRQQFETMIRPLIQRSIELIDKLLEEKNFPIETIDNILLVGGSSCIPLVKKMLSDKYGADKVLSSEKPMLAIAEGAAILAHSLPTEEELPGDGPLLEDPKQESEEIIVHTTKRATFIEIEEENGNKSYEKIIDSGEVLPHEKNRQFFTLADNQKIVGVKLFSEKEDGSYEPTSTGFFTISENLPKKSRLLFTFNIDLDETISIRVKVDATGKSQEIITGHGNYDSACLSALSQAIRDINTNGDISSEDRVSFMKTIQGLIDRINSKKRDDMDPEWTTIKSDLESRIPVVESHNQKEVFFNIAQILLDVFGHFLRPQDANRLKGLIDSYSFSKSESDLDAMEEITSNYGLLIDVYLYTILAHRATDPVVANKAESLYKQMMNDLNNHNVDSVKTTLKANNAFLNENLDRLGGGGIDIIRDGLGK